MKWHEGKFCAICGKPFGKIRWANNKPPLIVPDGTTMETMSVSSDQISELLATHKRLCWYYHVDRASGRMSAAPARHGKPAAKKEM
jgi:hypothetical protein